MSKIIKNISGETKTWAGVEILNNTTYLCLNQEEANRFSQDDAFLVSLSNNHAQVYVDETLISGISNSLAILSDSLRDENGSLLVVQSSVEIDDQGRQIVRAAAGKAGWSYISHPLEFQTAKLGSVFAKKYDNTDRNDLTIKFYDINNAEVISVENESTIVKTTVLFKPNYDYELISGSIRQTIVAPSDLRVWVIGGIIELGYVKEFVGGLNLVYVGQDEEIKTDGRAAKYMTKTVPGVPYQANQIQIIVRHEPGVQHKIMLVLEYFRE